MSDQEVPTTSNGDESAVEFVDGLPGRMQPAKFMESILAQLAEKPGQWAKIKAYSKPSGSSVAASRLRKKFEGYEFVSRKSTLYGRKIAT